MRKIVICLNFIVTMFFACFLAYTFFARTHLDYLARRFVTEKTLHYSEPIVEIADQSLDSPLVKKLLSNAKAVALRNEISAYRSDPSSYVSDLTRETIQRHENADRNPIHDKIGSVKERIRTFYDNTLAALISDLQLFSATNLFATTIALGLAYYSRSNIQKSIVWFSFIMFVGVLYCSYLYINDLTFFRILCSAHMGWWYPFFLGLAIIFLYLDYGRDHAQEPRDTVEPPRKTASDEESSAAKV